MNISEKVARNKLNKTLEEVINKIDTKKKQIKETQNNLLNDNESFSPSNIEKIKSKYDEAMVVWELRKNKIKKKIEEYSADGSENWDSFKHKLNHDLEELGAALKGFVTKSSTDHKQ